MQKWTEGASAFAWLLITRCNRRRSIAEAKLQMEKGPLVAQQACLGCVSEQTMSFEKTKYFSLTTRATVNQESQ